MKSSSHVCISNVVKVFSVSSFDNQRPYRRHAVRKKQVGVVPTVPPITSLNGTEGRGRGPAATRDPSTQADEASGSQKVLVLDLAGPNLKGAFYTTVVVKQFSYQIFL